MRRIPKIFTGFIFVFCLLIAALIFTACDTSDNSSGNSDNSASSSVEEAEGYKFTVLYPDNTPVEGVFVQLCVGELCRLPVKTDANGVALVEVDEAEYEIHLQKLPEGYTFDDTAYKTTATYGEFTLYLVAETE